MTTATQSVPAGTYNIDAGHSNVGFEVRHMGIATVRGAFKTFQGSVESSDAGLQLTGTVDTASVDTGEPNRDGHLASPEFFDAAQFPQITFRSTSVEPDSDGKLKLTGEITLRGVTRAIVLTGVVGETTEDPWGNQRVGFEVESKIDRRDFGLDWNQILPNGNLLVSNDVKLIVSVSAVRAA